MTKQNCKKMNGSNEPGILVYYMIPMGFRNLAATPSVQNFHSVSIEIPKPSHKMTSTRRINTTSVGEE